MMTGRMPHETGITVNRSSQTNLLKVPMMGSIFRQAGYDCGYVGK
jgi:arylsulfatase A-like enzyme